MKYFKLSLIAASVLACGTGMATAGSKGAAQGVSVALSSRPVDVIEAMHSDGRNVELLRAHSKTNSNRTTLAIGGRVAADVTYNKLDVPGRTDTGGYQGNTSVNVAKLNLDANINRWVSGFMSFGKNDDNISNTSGFIIQQAYVTVGNLSSNPFFASAGSMYAPFASGHNYLVTNTFVEQFGQTSADMVDVGYSKNGLTAQAYGFKGAYKKKSTDQNNMMEGGVAVDYSRKVGVGRVEVGAEYLSNMAEANLFSNTSATYVDSSVMTKRIGAFSAHARLDAAKYDVSVSYVAALKKFEDAGAVFKGKTIVSGTYQDQIKGKLAALDVQAVYKARLAGKQWYLGAGYAMTKNARNVTRTDCTVMPKSAVSLIADVKLWKNTMLAMQYSNERNYKAKGTYTRDRSKQNRFQAEFNVYF